MIIRILFAAAALLLPAAAVSASGPDGKGAGRELMRMMDEAHQKRMKTDPAYRHETLGDEHAKKKDFAKAAGEYERAVKHAPKNAHLHAKLANALVASGRAREALPMADKAIALSKGKENWLYWAWLSKGMAHGAQGDMDAAIDALSRSIALKPTLTAYVGRGGAHAEKGDLKAAVRDYEEVVKLEPGNRDLWIMKAQLHMMSAARNPNTADRLAACQAMRKACELGECRLLEQFPDCKKE